MNKKIIYLYLLLFLGSAAMVHAQDTSINEIARMVPTAIREYGHPQPQLSKNTQLTLSFMTSNNHKLIMSASNNIGLKNKGELIFIYKRDMVETAKQGSIEKYYFYWPYTFSGLDLTPEKGSGIVCISKIHSSMGLSFQIEIIDETNETLLTAGGYVQGKDHLEQLLQSL